MIDPIRSDGLRFPHAFFTRDGGVSEGIYASLQCGFGASGDQAARVAENRARAAAALGARTILTAHQIHSAEVAVIDAETSWAPETAPRADGLVTRAAGVAIGALAADCAPVLFEDRTGGVVGACHAGWKGALGGIVEATVEAMVDLGARRDRISAVVGPCIGPDAYQVGAEFVERFEADDPANADFFGDDPEDGRARFNLPAFVVGRAMAAGVRMPLWVGRCTYSEPDAFFSNRRALHQDEPDYGRLLSAIMMSEVPA